MACSVSTKIIKMENRDSELWKLAQKKASFKSHLAVYIIMNIFFDSMVFYRPKIFRCNEVSMGGIANVRMGYRTLLSFYGSIYLSKT